MLDSEAGLTITVALAVVVPPEPVAVIDTLGVDPLQAHHGVGRALLSQLFANLSALGIERVETVVASGSLELLGFFHAAGFRPSERLSFLKRL